MEHVLLLATALWNVSSCWQLQRGTCAVAGNCPMKCILLLAMDPRNVLFCWQPCGVRAAIGILPRALSMATA